MNKRTVIILVAATTVAGIFALTSFRASRVYAVESRFTDAPQDDVQLDGWLKSQPGVVPHTVDVARHDGMLVLTFIMTQDLSLIHI